MLAPSYISKALLRRGYSSIPGIKKPEWLKVKVSNSNINNFTKSILSENRLTTVCEEAACPNIHECWSKKHATFMILGDTCTRSCSFCNVKTGMPSAVDVFEPSRVANAVYDLNLKHVVITSVDRDDLDDGGAMQFVNVIKEIKNKSPITTIEILTPDFYKKTNALALLDSAPFEIFNHNIETVPRLYRSVRPGSNFNRSLNLLLNVKKMNNKIFTKSGIMLGLGETYDEVLLAMDCLLEHNVDFLTIGQYLQPSVRHHPLDRYYHPNEFKEFETIAKSKGFLLVSSTPLTRSSYHADEDFAQLQKNRLKN